jgi:MazG family protein
MDAVDRGDADELCSELGDVLFQCVFHAQIATERRTFDIADVIGAITAKLIRRHPHVFTPTGRRLSAARRRAQDAKTPAAVLTRWEQLKAEEQRAAGAPSRVLAGIPRALPALLRAHKIGGRVATVGFDWPTAPDIVSKIDEEVVELRAALNEGPERVKDEMGDLLFSIANLARKLRIEPEAALAQANDKFTQRFDAVESWLESRQSDVHRATASELEAAWTAVKRMTADRAVTGESARRAPTRPSPKSSARAPRPRRSRR